ncbi:DUF6225 family protein [Streptomyces sp. NPDC005533]|uniref:DUF6225 family protein n=1 Tax=Streptomyces sp. NPDC005533 TaxID=3364723 RepID=UPI0036BD3EE7
MVDTIKRTPRVCTLRDAFLFLPGETSIRIGAADSPDGFEDHGESMLLEAEPMENDPAGLMASSKHAEGRSTS